MRWAQRMHWLPGLVVGMSSTGLADPAGCPWYQSLQLKDLGVVGCRMKTYLLVSPFSSPPEPQTQTLDHSPFMPNARSLKSGSVLPSGYIHVIRRYQAQISHSQNFLNQLK